MSNLRHIVAALKSLVKSENSQLRKGVYTELQKTIPQKNSLTQMLETELRALGTQSREGLLATELQRLQNLLKENDYLMRSAMNSLRLAHKQLSVIRNTEKKVGAYNRYGGTVYMDDLPGLRYKLV
jgi:hypothetical protein